MGEVWRARDTRLGRDVALKVLPEDLVGNAERRSRLEQEARLLASLNHPSIAALHDVLEDQKLFDWSDEFLTTAVFQYDVSPDGQHFVMIEKDPLEQRPLDLVVVPGWGEEMKARLAAAK